MVRLYELNTSTGAFRRALMQNGIQIDIVDSVCQDHVSASIQSQLGLLHRRDLTKNIDFTQPIDILYHETQVATDQLMVIEDLLEHSSYPPRMIIWYVVRSYQKPSWEPRDRHIQCLMSYGYTVRSLPMNVCNTSGYPVDRKETLIVAWFGDGYVESLPICHMSPLSDFVDSAYSSYIRYPNNIPYPSVVRPTDTIQILPPGINVPNDQHIYVPVNPQFYSGRCRTYGICQMIKRQLTPIEKTMLMGYSRDETMAIFASDVPVHRVLSTIVKSPHAGLMKEFVAHISHIIPKDYFMPLYPAIQTEEMYKIPEIQTWAAEMAADTEMSTEKEWPTEMASEEANEEEEHTQEVMSTEKEWPTEMASEEANEEEEHTQEKAAVMSTEKEWPTEMAPEEANKEKGEANEDHTQEKAADKELLSEKLAPEEANEEKDEAEMALAPEEAKKEKEIVPSLKGKYNIRSDDGKTIDPEVMKGIRALLRKEIGNAAREQLWKLIARIEMSLFSDSDDSDSSDDEGDSDDDDTDNDTDIDSEEYEEDIEYELCVSIYNFYKKLQLINDEEESPALRKLIDLIKPHVMKTTVLHDIYDLIVRIDHASRTLVESLEKERLNKLTEELNDIVTTQNAIQHEFEDNSIKEIMMSNIDGCSEEISKNDDAQIKDGGDDESEGHVDAEEAHTDNRSYCDVVRGIKK